MHAPSFSSSCSFMISFTSVNQFLGRSKGQSPSIAQLRAPVTPGPKAAPRPVLRTADDAGRQGIPLHVSAHRQEVLVLLNGKALETPLIEVSAADCVVRHVPAHGMGVGQPPKIGSHFSFLLRPDHEVPVRSHGAPCQNPQGVPIVGLDHDPLESLEIGLFAKQGKPCHRPVQDVVHIAAGCCSCSSWHLVTLPQTGLACQKQLAASRFRCPGKRHAAVRANSEQSPFPIIPRLNPRTHKTILQGLDRQFLGCYALTTSRLVENSLQVGANIQYHS